MIIGCEERMCTKCLSTFALDQFATAKKGKFGRMSICRKCFHDIYYVPNKEPLLGAV